MNIHLAWHVPCRVGCLPPFDIFTIKWKLVVLEFESQKKKKKIFSPQIYHLSIIIQVFTIEISCEKIIDRFDAKISTKTTTDQVMNFRRLAFLAFFHDIFDSRPTSSGRRLKGEGGRGERGGVGGGGGGGELLQGSNGGPRAAYKIQFYHRGKPARWDSKQ